MEGSKKLENFPAFPCNSPDGQESYRGMSKRFYAACAAMQAILSNEELRFKCIEDSKTLKQSPTENIIEYAYQNADELLRQEEKI